MEDIPKVSREGKAPQIACFCASFAALLIELK
jgi:hypothetical protein